MKKSDCYTKYKPNETLQSYIHLNKTSHTMSLNPLPKITWTLHLINEIVFELVSRHSIQLFTISIFYKTSQLTDFKEKNAQLINYKYHAFFYNIYNPRVDGQDVRTT